MLAALIITFRETLEAALIVGIILAHLKKTSQSRYNALVWTAVLSGVIVSILAAFIFQRFLGGFTGRIEEIVEGILMLVGAALLTTMIFWMMRRQQVAKTLQDKVDASMNSAKKIELFSLVFVAVLREGIETVIFMSALLVSSESGNLLGGLIGIPLAALLGYGLYKKALSLNLKKFFTYTGILLILFAAGLVAHGVHELQEASLLPTYIEHVWDINPPVIEVGVYPALHEQGTIGSIAKGLFGYNGNPSLLEIIAYVTYIVFIWYAWRRWIPTHPKQKNVAGKQMETSEN